MARSRNIKPSFFTNDELAECEPLARILFAGLWTIADREGRLEDRPKKIKAEVLPYDECDPDALIQQLSDKGFILRYSSCGRTYIQILSFAKHQNPHQKEAASVIPAPEQHQTSTGQEPDKPGLNPITDSLNLIPSSREKIVSAAPPDGSAQPKASKPKRKTGTRLPSDWKVSVEDGEWAETLLPRDQILIEQEKFRDHWTAKGGRDAVKMDWSATWRNWIRNAVEYRRKK